MHTTEGIWLSISDYSVYKKISVSTIRRHIKSNIVQSKEVDGKYFIYISNPEKLKMKEDEEILRLKLEIELLKKQLTDFREQADELKMLVNLYEHKSTQIVLTDEPPELPAHL
jgi:hypothetical protein